jgi:hypothetical protein
MLWGMRGLAAMFHTFSIFCHCHFRVRDITLPAIPRITSTYDPPDDLPMTVTRPGAQYQPSGSPVAVGPMPIYDRGGVLYRPVRIEAQSTSDGVRRPAGALVLRAVEPTWLRVKLADAAQWLKWDARRKKTQRADPRVTLVRSSRRNRTLLTGLYCVAWWRTRS